MRLNVKEKKKNDLFKRTELTFEVTESKVTPSRKELREKLAAVENAPLQYVIIQAITPSFGKHDVHGTAVIYKDEKTMKEVELAYWVDANNGIKKPKAGEKKE